MNPKRVLDLFLEMTAIESPSWSEREMADYCKAQLESMGFIVFEDGAGGKIGANAGNLIARLKGNAGGSIAFCSHMDTVVPCEGIEAVVEKRVMDGEGEVDVICSAGPTILSADDKSGIAAIFEGVRSAIETGRPLPDITVLLTVCEEHDLQGSGALEDDALPQGIACYVLDADGRPGSIIAGAPFHYSFKAHFKGRAAHAGVEPEAGVSAIEAAACAISKMPLGRINDHTTANLGFIEGGAAINIVAADCTLEGECRSLYKEDIDTQKGAMTDAILEGANEVGAEVELAWSFDYPGVLYDAEHELIKRTSHAIESIGLTPNVMISGGGADANILAGKGIDAITLGIGMTNFHSTDEFIRVKDLEDTSRLVEAIIFEYAE